MQNVAIVTGSSAGLGRRIAEILVRDGYVVVGVSRRPASGGIRGLIEVNGSVADQQTVDEAFRVAVSAGRLVLVVNCAGQGVFGQPGEYSVSDIEAAVEGNLTGLIAFSDRAVREFGSEGGDIVNVMSTAAKKLRPAESVYTAVKWGAKAYTRTLREGIKAAKLPIRVFEVYPCGMNTAFWSSAVRPVADAASFPSPDGIAQVVHSAIRAKSDSYQQEITFERS